jgi:hypothetical protein
MQDHTEVSRGYRYSQRGARTSRPVANLGETCCCSCSIGSVLTAVICPTIPGESLRAYRRGAYLFFFYLLFGFVFLFMSIIVPPRTRPVSSMLLYDMTEAGSQTAAQKNLRNFKYGF